MARETYSQTSFNAGEWTERLRDRAFLESYQSAVAEMTNALPLIHGPFTRRPGTVRMAEAGAATVRLIPFIVSRSSKFTLEFSASSIRVFNGTSLVDTVATSYAAGELWDINYTRTGNTMYLVHPDHAPAKLIRFADNDWQLRTVTFLPPPTYEAGLVPALTLTLGATSGTGVSATISASFFLDSYVGRFISIIENTGLAVITSVTNATVAVVDILETFSTTAYTSALWQLEGSPQADLTLSATGPAGVTITVRASKEQPTAASIVTNGSFTAPVTEWDDFSAPLVVSGTADAGAGDAILIDAAATFISDGVQAGHVGYNLTDSNRERVDAVISETTLTMPTGGSNWQNDNYEIHKTGSALFVDGKATLNGGENGIAWIEQEVTTTDGLIYRVTWEGSDNPLSMMIGTTSQDNDILSELTYEIGENSVTFVASGTSAFIGFRNNQNANASVDNVTIRPDSIATFNAADEEKYIVGRSGVAQIRTVTESAVITAVILKAFDGDELIVAGAWTLESPKWDATLGFPSVITQHEGRVWYGSNEGFPLDLEGSIVRDPESFGRGTNDSDAISLTLTTDEANPFVWILGEVNLVIGTEGREHIVTGGNAPITPTNRIQRSMSSHGSAHVAPVRVASSIIFVERGGRRLRELAFDVDFTDQLARQAPDVTRYAFGILDGVVKELIYQQSPDSQLYAVLENGDFVVAIYNRAEEANGWARFDFGDAEVMSACCVPAGDIDRVILAIDRDGTTQLEFFDVENGYYGPVQVDSAVLYDGVATSTLTGLTHLNGVECDVLGNGANLGTYTPNGGSITLEEGTVIRAEIGRPFDTTVRLLRPGRPDANTLGHDANVVSITVGFLDSIGGSMNGEPIAERLEEDELDTAPTPFTGYHRFTGHLGDVDYNTVSITQTDPLPLTITSVTRIVEVSAQ